MSIPMITDGPWKIIGEGIAVYTYLMNSYPKMRAQFFSEEQESQINDVFRHFMTKVRKTTTQLIRCIANKKVFNMPKQPIDQEKLERYLQDFILILQKYEGQLRSNPYLTGQKITFVDIVIFIEIETFFI